MNSAPPSTPIPGEPGKPWLTICLVAVFLLGGLGLFLWAPAKALVRDQMAGYYAGKAAALVKEEAWNDARVALARAGFWRPDHPALLRATADFLIATKGPPHSTLHYLRLLDSSGEAGEQDLVAMARLLADTQSLSAAEAVLERLSPAAREQPEALEVLSALQRQRGQKTLADQTLRRALGIKPGDRAARLRLAVLDLNEPFQEVRAKARQSLWELAGGRDEHALEAIGHLARDQDLLPLEADRLLETVRQHPGAPEPLRLEVLSGLIRARPDRKEQIVAAESGHMRDLPADKLRPCLLWLLRQGLAKNIIALHPREHFTSSADLIDPYFQALAALERWQEIEDLLARPAGMPVSAGYASFWRAQATLKIDHEPTRARQHLMAVWEAAGRGRHAELARAGAALADHAGQWDLAATFYQGLAEQQPGQRVQMLEKVLEVARHAGDAETLMRAAAQLHEARPDDRRFLFNHIYLRLICGRELELAIHELATLPEAVRVGADEAGLCQALAAHRQARPEEVRRWLAEVRESSGLPAWQRAVHAGLLALDGRTAAAFQQAERLSAELLLEEERRFLGRAR